MKCCSDCHDNKPLDSFRYGHLRCRECEKKRRNLRRNERRKLDSEFRQHEIDRTKEWKAKNRDHVLQSKRDWNKANKAHIDQYAHDRYFAMPLAERKALNRKHTIAKVKSGCLHNDIRRARELNSPIVEKINRLDIIRRDGRVCYLCKQSIPDEPYLLAIDHVVPLSRGGAHTADNLRVACRQCNGRKRCKLLSELDWYNP